MKSKMGVSVSVRGLSFVLVLFVVTYCGVLALVSPLLLLLPISLSIYRRWIDYFLALWYHLPTVGPWTTRSAYRIFPLIFMLR